MRGVLLFVAAALVLGGSDSHAADPADEALEERVARLERLLAARANAKTKGAPMKWKDPQTGQMLKGASQRTEKPKGAQAPR